MSTTKQKQNRKYCLVPQCANTNKNAPGKLFFCVPMHSEIRKKWLTAMKRANSVGDKSKVFCCEDHFDIEEDTSNYIQYKIMCSHEKYKTTLRLKKGILPHKFHCQSNTAPQPKRKAYKKRRHLEIIKEALSPPACTTPDLTEISQIDPLEANTSSPEIYTEDIETKYVCEVNCSDSLTTKNKMYVDKAVQVNRKIHSRSKGVNVNLCVKKKDKGVSTFPISRKSRSTSLKVAHKSDFKRGLLQDPCPADTASVSSAQPSVLSSASFKSEISLPDSSCLYKNECNII